MFNYIIVGAGLAGAVMAERIADELDERVLVIERRNHISGNCYDLRFLADYIYRKVFLNYTMKQWGLKPEEIDPEVTGRVPVVLSNDDRYFQDTYQAVPLRGYTGMIGRMLDHPNIKLMLNTSHDEVLELRDGSIFVMGSEFRGKLVFTGKIDELFNYRYGELPYRSLDFRFEAHDMEWFQEAATINYPNNYDYTRITEFKHLHPVRSERTVIVKEYPCSHVRGENEACYPIFTEETREMYRRYLELAADYDNLVLVGRLAEYRYYDMDDIVKRSLDVFREMIL